MASKDSKMYYISDDIEKIKIKQNMYIQEVGKEGSAHLAREIIQNAIDECIDENSPGKTITIRYDKATDLLSVEDDGRGISEVDYPMSIFCTTIQSGSKFFRNSGAMTSGEFGVGMSVVNALSSVFKITSFREQEGTKHTLVFEEGRLVKDETKKNQGKHGTLVEFRTSPKYMGEGCELPIDDVINWIESMFYLDSRTFKERDVKCIIDVYDGMKAISHTKLKAKPFSDLLERSIPSNFTKKDLTPLISLHAESKWEEEAKTLMENEDGSKSLTTAMTEKSITMDIAFRYVITDLNLGATYVTYCNFTNTIDHGSHLEAVDEALCRYLGAKSQESLPDSQKEKYKILWEDVRSNLFCNINLLSNAIGFQGNAKTKIEAKDLIPRMKEMVTSALDDYFKDHASELSILEKIIKLNAKARVEAQKARQTSTKEKVNSFDELLMTNYIKCNNTGKQFKELFVVEGNSAASGARNGADCDTQAFFLLRGVVANPFKCTLQEIMQNREWHDLVKILRCGIGENFDINKLYFNRINIMTDADIDGSNITGGILAFMYKYYRPLIEAGYVYKVFSPLYKIADKNHPFVANKSEMTKLYHKKIMKSYKIRLNGMKEWFSKDEFYQFLIDTYDYRDDLILAADSCGKINKFLVEAVCAFLTITGKVRDDLDYDDIETIFKDQKTLKDMKKVLNDRKFNEVDIDETGRFTGIIDGKAVILKLSQRFYKKTNSLIDVFKKYGYLLDVSEKDGKPVVMTIGEFLDHTMKLVPIIETRYKGLGELNADELWSTTLDVSKRVSVRFTVEDFERELGIFELTHGESKQNRIDRQEMMKHFKIRREDLDN